MKKAKQNISLNKEQSDRLMKMQATINVGTPINFMRIIHVCQHERLENEMEVVGAIHNPLSFFSEAIIKKLKKSQHRKRYRLWMKNSQKRKPRTLQLRLIKIPIHCKLLLKNIIIINRKNPIHKFKSIKAKDTSTSKT